MAKRVSTGVIWCDSILFCWLASDLLRKVGEALPRIPDIDSLDFHERVKSMYSWEEVAERTERVYERIYKQPQLPLIERFRRYYGCGPFAGKLFVLVVALGYILWQLLEYHRPRADIDIAINFPSQEWAKPAYRRKLKAQARAHSQKNANGDIPGSQVKRHSISQNSRIK